MTMGTLTPRSSPRLDVVAVVDTRSGTHLVTRRALLQVGGMAAFSTFVASACSGGSESSVRSDKVLTIGQQLKPNSLDQVTANGALQMYVWLAYDSLIYRAPDGRLAPRLATSWRYIGTRNKLFEMKLRPNVKFNDGSPLTADVVRANIEYANQTGAEVSPRLASVHSVDAVDDLTVRLTLSDPFPLLPDLFTRGFLSVNVVSGEALKQSAKLANQSFGAGPYVLDSNATVAGDYYTYTPNPRYWDKKAVRYQKIIIKVLPNPNTARPLSRPVRPT
jgi:peptide/nickel transport system substrate-binding protein